ncbi:MAG: holo-ACP synthase [Candidatus Kapabacteria bacterium]|nr:holo-ACP synthase [Ignavibacteriota bacterium]MCW5884373.1 holo-ACP synthase [Candidatus Kapabacteria bacterium]
MIYGIGTDIVETSRIQTAIEKYGKRFLDRLYTELEQQYCDSFNETKYVHYAARFAAKESFSKAIGTGLTQGFKFKEISIRNERNGKPVIVLDGDLLEKYGHLKSHVSLSHTDNNSLAYIILEETE